MVELSGSYRDVTVEHGTRVWLKWSRSCCCSYRSAPRNPPPQHSDYRVRVSNLSSRVSWQVWSAQLYLVVRAKIEDATAYPGVD